MMHAREWFFDSFLGVFVNGFCVSLVLPGIPLVLFLILGLRFGAGVGLPLLFWRPRVMSRSEPGATRPGRTRANWTAQFFVGIGVGALVWQVFLAGYLFEEFATNFTKDRPPICETRDGDVPDEPAFGGNDHGYPKRFRYDPQGLGSMWLYAGVVGSGLLFMGAVVLVLWFAWWTATRLYRRAIGWEPFDPPSPLDRPASWKRKFNRVVQILTSLQPFPDASDRTPIPYSPALPLGFAAGLIVLSFITRGLFDNPFGLRPDAIGTGMVQLAGWGESEERQATLRGRVTGIQVEETDTDQKWKRGEFLRPYYPVYGAFALNFLLITMTTVVMMLLPGGILGFSPVVGLVFLLNLLLFLHVVLSYFSPLPDEFVVLCVVALILAAGRGYKLKFPHMETYYADPVRLSAIYADRAAVEAHESDEKQVPTPPPGVELLESRKIPFPHPTVGNRKCPLAIVCVSGGGSRAAAWTMKVLLELEKAFGDPSGFWSKLATQGGSTVPATPDLKPVAFPYHVRLVTGASGGMIAGAQYVASLDRPSAAGQVSRNPPHERKGPDQPGGFTSGPLTHEQLFDGVCQDFLTPIVHTLVSRDLPSLFLPTHVTGFDRGQAIEEAWRKALHGQLDQTFVELKTGEREGWRPSLIFSPMLVEDGRQLFISNLELTSVVRNRAMLLGEEPEPGEDRHGSGVEENLNPRGKDGRRLLSREGLEFFKTFPRAEGFRVSTAARMSASFPYVLPAVPLPTNPPRRVVDAGYYDNYGVGIAASWLFTHLDWVRDHASGVVVIQIRDGASGGSRRRERVFDAFPSVPDLGLQWATSPPKGLWNFRTAAHAFRNDNLLHLLDGFFREQHTGGTSWFDPAFFTTVSFELQRGDDVALNFTLTESERQVILDAVGETGFLRQVGSLLQWWHGR